MRLLAAPLAVAALLLVTGCSAGGPSATTLPAPASSTAPSPTPAPAPTPTPSTPAAATVLVIGDTGLDAGADGSASFSDGAGVLALAEALSGESPTPVGVPGCPEGYQCDPIDRYDFTGMQVFLQSNGQSFVSIDAPDLAGVPLQTAQGIHVGSTRDEALAAGAFSLDYPPVAPDLAIGGTEVAGTQSLSTPGATGVQFVMLSMNGGDTVVGMQQGDDFSDL